MSGEWRWPARGADAVYCTPSDSTFSLATGEPCRNGREAREYVRLPVGASRYRGLGQVDLALRSITGCGATGCRHRMQACASERPAMSEVWPPRFGLSRSAIQAPALPTWSSSFRASMAGTRSQLARCWREENARTYIEASL